MDNEKCSDLYDRKDLVKSSTSNHIHSKYHHSLMRSLNSNKSIYNVDHLMLPIFITSEGNNIQENISSMPGVYRWSVDNLPTLLDPLIKKGLKSVLLFGVIKNTNDKDYEGSIATHEYGPIIKGIKFIKNNYPDLFVAVDVCLCPYTNHGHCGVLNSLGNDIDNEKSIIRLAEIGLAYAKAGADMLAPSDMMDGRINMIKEYLRINNLSRRVCVMAYSAKFASSLYGPFRDAADCKPHGFDRKTYQLPIGSIELAIKATQRDIDEGADMIMVKPATYYLDVVSKIKSQFNTLVCCYHVSGEYVSLLAASESKAIDLNTTLHELMTSFRRSGVDLIVTYFVPTLLDMLNE